MRYIAIQFKKRYSLIVLCVLVCIALLGCGKDTTEYFSREDNTSAEEDRVDSECDTEAEQPDTENGYLYVYVCGHVNEPGVFRFLENDRICDAIERAGGFSKQACTDYWNLAEKLSDGERIYVPTKEEARKLESSANAEAEAVAEAANSDGKVNINTASKDELMSLSGIGEAKAMGIINYRTENGSFTSVEDITNVSGIGNALFSNIKDYITI